ncbi:MAG: chemotaxis protein CheW [Methylobacteriaceae bacterium]|nr:chemotaxis protein CheW [Methylobacteriaceae bacterium]
MSALALRQTGHAKPLPGASAEQRCFTVIDGDEMFGLPVQSVQTIFRIGGVTPVPLGPADVEGLVNLRGRIVTAVSLKRRLGNAPLRSARGELAIGIEHDGENFALIVDEVGDVIPCDESATITRPPHIDPTRARLIRAYYRLDSGILPILDMDAVFDFADRNRPSVSQSHNNTAMRRNQ